MFEEFQICPYTGLRSFTEEESLYFKGREEDIDQATEQLQRNKFLMLTGASGDGKSSLIYAGIIPNARSGFLKSKYTQWCVAGFRPERTPFQNLCGALAKQLDIPNPETVQAELNHGFSALVDLYKNSKRYADTNSIAWQQADDAGKATLRRQAANLVILVDQFEEFFTNPEHYQHGAPSNDANLVLNILLETARMALDEDLPIYIVFTMRSDYIGQCAAFRGLPEYIGFSQFFVPRLSRAQLQQVIEEPARLSGNRITRRLTERLIHDITEGVDQLPILQHALNQIWVAASNGKEEMDLLHYAMVGGMNSNELPDEQMPRFNEWFGELEPEIKACYHAPTLQNVLDTHTNKLYEQAADYYKIKTGKEISHADAKLIIKTAFTCLTKIDQGRAVRNRMTLQEITNILGLPAFDAKTVGAVLNIFREPGNTFIQPFILEEDPASRQLDPEQVLDITHESLIRNWQYLGRWAKEEFENRSVFSDFERQAGRWVDSDKSNAFLLSIGPLTYFENWYNKVKPNEWWIARYLPDDQERETRLKKSAVIVSDSREFIARSASRHAITRAFIRYGTKRIAMIVGIIALITLSSFVAKTYLSRQNSAVLNSIHSETLHLVSNPKVLLMNNAGLVVEELKAGSLTIDEVIGAVHDPVQQSTITNGVGASLLLRGRDEPRQLIINCLLKEDSLLDKFSIPIDNAELLSTSLKTINDFNTNLLTAYTNIPDTLVDRLERKSADRTARWVLTILDKQPAGFSDIQNLTLALENAINLQGFSGKDLDHLLGILSPFENGLQSEWLRNHFQHDQLLPRGFLEYGFLFNGLYQELAYLYAAKGNSGKALMCMDSLLRYAQNNYQGDYGSGADNAANIAAVYFTNHTTTQLDEFVQGYCSRKKIGEEEFYSRLIGRTIKSVYTIGAVNLYWFTNRPLTNNLNLCRRDLLIFFMDKYRSVIEKTITDKDQREFLLAVAYKQQGILLSRNNEKPIAGELTQDEYFSEAFKHYFQVNDSWLNANQTIIGTASGDQIVEARKFLFVFPDVKTPFHPQEPRSYFYFYNNANFIQYILNHDLFSKIYTGASELNAISTWLLDYNSKSFTSGNFDIHPPDFATMLKLDTALQQVQLPQNFNLNILYLLLGRDFQEAGDTSRMLSYYGRVNFGAIYSILNIKEYEGQVNDHTFLNIAYCIEAFAQTGQVDKACALVNTFKNPINRSSLYAFIADDLLRSKSPNSLADRMIDSAKAEASRSENLTHGIPNRSVLANALVLQSPQKNGDEAVRLIKNLQAKAEARNNICRSYGFRGELYKGRSVIPASLSDTDLAGYLWYLMMGYNEGRGDSSADWKKFNDTYFYRFVRYIRYIDELS